MAPKSRQKSNKASTEDSIRVGAGDNASKPESKAPKAEHAPQPPHWPSRGIAAAALGLLAYGAKVALRIPADSLNTWAGEPLKQSFTAMGPINGLLAKMVSAFSFPLSGKHPESRVQTTYLLPMLGATVLVWTIEGWRRDQRPSTFLAAYQIFGIGLVAPLYFALSILSDKGDTLSVSLSPDIAKAVFPGVLFGFFLPTFFMFLEHSDMVLHQKITALWQASPVFGAVLTTFLAAFFRRASLGPDSTKFNQAKLAEKKTGNPLPALRIAYALTTVILASVHHYLLFDIGSTAETSLYDVFFNLPHPFADWDLSDPYSAMAIFLKFDLIFYTLSIVGIPAVLHRRFKDARLHHHKPGSPGSYSCAHRAIDRWTRSDICGFWWWREEMLAAKA